MTKLTHDKIAAGLNEALAVAQGKTTLEKRDVFGFTTRRGDVLKLEAVDD